MTTIAESDVALGWAPVPAGRPLPEWVRRNRWWVGRIAPIPFQLLVFAIVVLIRTIPSDHFEQAVGQDAMQRAYDAAKHRLGLDGSVWHHFVRYLGNVAHLDFGQSTCSDRSIWSDIRHLFAASVEPSLMGTVASTSRWITQRTMPNAPCGQPVPSLSDSACRAFRPPTASSVGTRDNARGNPTGYLKDQYTRLLDPRGGSITNPFTADAGAVWNLTEQILVNGAPVIYIARIQAAKAARKGVMGLQASTGPINWSLVSVPAR
jgi:hypothetical protein